LAALAFALCAIVLCVDRGTAGRVGGRRKMGESKEEEEEEEEEEEKEEEEEGKEEIFWHAKRFPDCPERKQSGLAGFCTL
jgi:hypothetical protein